MIKTQELFGKRLKEIRKTNNLSQAELADKLGVDEKYISRLETGVSTPSFGMMIRLSDALNTDIKSFFTFDGNKTRSEIIERINYRLKCASDDNIRIVDKIIENIMV